MLHLIGKKYDSKNIGLYRDGGLAVFKNVSGPASEKIKEHLQYLFQQKSLQIIIECNLKVANYLDVTFDLNDGSYRPYRKPNHETHIHIQSDPPPSMATVHRKALITIIIIMKRHHIMGNVSPANEKLTYQKQGENIENIENIWKNRKSTLHGLNNLQQIVENKHWQIHF